MFAFAEQRSLQRGDSTDPSALMRTGGAMLDPLALNDATPVASRPVLGEGRWLDDWLGHPDFDEYWKDQDWSTRLDEITVPVLDIGGWYHLKVHGQAADFTRIRSAAGSDEAREQSRLVIALRLQISPRTVHKHLENLYTKLGVRDRLQAVIVAQRNGLLATPCSVDAEQRPVLPQRVRWPLTRFEE
jgi:predicted acyl esterase